MAYLQGYLYSCHLPQEHVFSWIIFCVSFGQHHGTGLLNLKSAILYRMGILQKAVLKVEGN